MKPEKSVMVLLFCLLALHCDSQDIFNPVSSMDDITSKESSTKRLNFFVISKRKKGKLDLATRFNVMRAKAKSFFRPRNFVAIVSGDAEMAGRKISRRLKKYDANIGTLWFDSHGMYKKGYSLFLIGLDEISYESLQDTSISNVFNKLSVFADSLTKIVIGSCYGGATYSRSAVDYSDTTRMNGDSLMIGLAKIFTYSKIYASESWVMTKPGIFNNRKVAVAGFPKRKLFRDICYKPAWENIGRWNEYDAAHKIFKNINPVMMDSYGNLQLSTISYSDRHDIKKDIARNLSRLEPDLYK